MCGGGLRRVDGSVRCEQGHAFDVARTGYVSMLTGTAPGVEADSAGMVGARSRVLGAGRFGPLTAALLRVAADIVDERQLTLVVDVGGGTGHYLAAILDALPEAQGLVLDLSRDAARVAARAHPRMVAVVCDVRHRLPVQDAGASLLLDVFAPRNGAEMRRIVAPDGRLIVVTPTQTHLQELGGVPGMLHVDVHKDERLERSMLGYFTLAERSTVTWQMSLDRAAVRDVVLMGPSAHHVHPEALDQALAATDDPLDVTGAVDCSVWLPD